MRWNDRVISMRFGIFTRRPLMLRFTIGLLVVAVVLMWADSKSPAWFVKARSATHAAMQPIYQFSLIPNFAAHWAQGTLQTKESLRRENLRLQTELLHTKAKLQQQDYVLAQNARLQGVLSTTKPEHYDLELAQVIGTDSDIVKQTVVLNKGSTDGVEVGQAVIDEKGILGQITNVYANTSRLLFLSDTEQAIAVIVKRTGQKAIVNGLGDPHKLSLDYIYKAEDIAVGDELISSGLGGRFPAGYKVGTVAAVNDEIKNRHLVIDVDPAANFIDNAYVLVMQNKNAQYPAPANKLLGVMPTTQSTNK